MEHGARRNVEFDYIRGTVLGRAGASWGAWFLVSRLRKSPFRVVIHCVDINARTIAYGDGNGDPFAPGRATPVRS